MRKKVLVRIPAKYHNVGRIRIFEPSEITWQVCMCSKFKWVFYAGNLVLQHLTCFVLHSRNFTLSCRPEGPTRRLCDGKNVVLLRILWSIVTYAFFSILIAKKSSVNSQYLDVELSKDGATILPIISLRLKSTPRVRKTPREEDSSVR